MFSITDIASIVAAAAAVGALCYAAALRARPRPAGEEAASRNPSGVPWLLALLACAAVAFNWYSQRHPARGAIGVLSGAHALSANDARIDIVRYAQAVDDAKRTFQIDYFPKNVGRDEARGIRHVGTLFSSETPLNDQTIDAAFMFLHVQLNEDKTVSNATLRVDQGDIFFPVPDTPAPGAVFYNDWVEGTKLIYAVSLIEYTDDQTKERQHIYSDSCIYYQKRVLHFCSEHNDSYVTE